MTTIYFVRHAESVYVEGRERSRGLSESGAEDARAVRDILLAEPIDRFVSSPYERAIATIRPAAEASAKDIAIEEDLRERTIGGFEPTSFQEAKRQVYEDFRFAFPAGESSEEAQARAVAVMESLLNNHAGERIAVGTHGDIMTLMLNHYDSQFGHSFWRSATMPDVYKLVFEEKRLIEVTRLWE